MGELLQPTHLLVIIVLSGVIPFWTIFRKAGYPPALCFLLLLPGINFVTLFWFAYSTWPAEKRQNDRRID